MLPLFLLGISQALLEINSGILALKKRGLRVIRSRVTSVSRLLGQTAVDVNFREQYKAAIVAVQRGGKNIDQPLSTVVFESGDTLILQASEDSPLLRLKPPTTDFYQKIEEEAAPFSPKIARPPSYKTLVNLVKLPNPLARRPSTNELRRSDSQNSDTGESELKKKSSKALNEAENEPSKKVSEEEDDFFLPPDDGELENGATTNGDVNGGTSASQNTVSMLHSHIINSVFSDTDIYDSDGISRMHPMRQLMK